MEVKKDILIEHLNIEDKTKEILKKAGYLTLGDLTSAKVEEVEKYFANVKEDGIWGYDGNHSFRHLRALLHRDYKLTFNGEFEQFGLTQEAATVPISQLELPTAIKTVLTRQLMAYTLGDILTVDYERFIKARNFGKHYLKVLKDYVHELGFTLKGEEPTLEEILTSLKERGVKLLEETFDNSKIYMPMYRNGIYSLEDLIEFGPEVNKILGFGPLRQQELATKMRELNLSFNVVPITAQKRPEETIDIPIPAVAIRPTDAMIEQAKIENETIRNRIKHKEKLVAEYDSLMAERKQLIAREQELDQLIQTKVSVMKEGISHGRK